MACELAKRWNSKSCPVVTTCYRLPIRFLPPPISDDLFRPDEGKRLILRSRSGRILTFQVRENAMPSDFENPENDAPEQDVQAGAHDSVKMSDLTEDSVDVSPEQLTGYELVADMMRRQDEVIAELDSLNLRIEAAIKEISEARKLEEQATNALEADTELIENVSDESDLAQDVRTAA